MTKDAGEEATVKDLAVRLRPELMVYSAAVAVLSYAAAAYCR